MMIIVYTKGGFISIKNQNSFNLSIDTHLNWWYYILVSTREWFRERRGDAIGKITDQSCSG